MRGENEPARQEKLKTWATPVVVALAVAALSVPSLLIAHFAFGASWIWAHFGASIFFAVLNATPLLLAGGAVWMALRDGYRRIQRTRMQR